MSKWLARLAPLALVLPLLGLIPYCNGAPIGVQVVRRDAFPVFNDPELLPGPVAEERGRIFDRDAVIGVAHGDEAKAYPITVMGVHELGNDSIGGIPIAVSW